MSLPSIDLSVSEKLKRDPEFRRSFFLAESSAKIAQQLINLRKRRKLNQAQIAEMLDTGQPAISRVESADYRNWSFNTLRRLAEAMDARLRVYIEPSEDVIPEYAAQDAQLSEDDHNLIGEPKTNDQSAIFPEQKPEPKIPEPPAAKVNPIPDGSMRGRIFEGSPQQ